MLHLNRKTSAGTVYGFCRSFAAHLPERVNEFSEYLRNQSVIYAVATTVNVDKKLCYIRNFSTDDSVLYICMKNKNREALDGIELLGNFKGILVHDHETLLCHYGIGHAECNSHILRYLKKNSEDTRNSWSNRRTELFCEMNKARKSITEMGKTSSMQEKLRFL